MLFEAYRRPRLWRAGVDELGCPFSCRRAPDMSSAEKQAKKCTATKLRKRGRENAPQPRPSPRLGLLSCCWLLTASGSAIKALMRTVISLMLVCCSKFSALACGNQCTRESVLLLEGASMKASVRISYMSPWEAKGGRASRRSRGIEEIYRTARS